MIDYRLDTEHGVLYIWPTVALEKKDFDDLARAVDPYLEEKGDLAGLIIEIKAFPGWESLGAMAAPFRFVRDHHRRIRKIAVVTNAALGTVAEKLASHFVSATIKHFTAGKQKEAKAWVTDRVSG
jgi:hypothetical protein